MPSYLKLGFMSIRKYNKLCDNKSHQSNTISSLKLSFKSFFFHNNDTLKFSDHLLFNSKAPNNILPPIFKSWSQFCYNIHHYGTTSSMKGCIFIKNLSGLITFKIFCHCKCHDSWNKMQGQMGEKALKDLRSSKINWLLTDKFIKLLNYYFFI